MESISAKSHHELQALLAGVDISVPHRGDKEDKRTTTHVERWSICKFLATYSHTRLVRYPLLVEKRERPDYRMSSRDLVVGIEITERGTAPAKAGAVLGTTRLSATVRRTREAIRTLFAGRVRDAAFERSLAPKGARGV